MAMTKVQVSMSSRPWKPILPTRKPAAKGPMIWASERVVCDMPEARASCSRGTRRETEAPRAGPWMERKVTISAMNG